MAFYLIDFENIKNISQLNDLLEQDTVVFFYSKNANCLTFDLHIELNKSPAKKELLVDKSSFFVGCGGGIFHCPVKSHSRCALLGTLAPSTPCFVVSTVEKTILNRFSLCCKLFARIPKGRAHRAQAARFKFPQTPAAKRKKKLGTPTGVPSFFVLCFLNRCCITDHIYSSYILTYSKNAF